MPAYAAAIPRPSRTLTEPEQATLLKGTGEHREGFRDHVIFAVRSALAGWYGEVRTWIIPRSR